MLNFYSDNTVGCHPKIMEALTKANNGPQASYGNDIYTETARKLFKKEFGEHVETFFFSTGSAANILGLSIVTKSYNCIITSEHSHLDQGECGGAEKFINCKIIRLTSNDGKITTKQIDEFVDSVRNDFHMPKTSVVSITQPTEFGTVYSLKEMEEISKCCKRNNLYFHVDGARYCNAAVYLNVPLKELSIGVDILTFGGTKNGLMFGDAVVILNKDLTTDFIYIQKQGMQLLSKMRFISSQFVEYLTNELWKENAKNANEMTKYLESLIHVKPNYKIESNILFINLSKTQHQELLKKYKFGKWDSNNFRFVACFNTTKKEVEELAIEINKVKSKL